MIEILTEAGVGVPLTIARKASEKAAELRGSARDSFERDDQVWAVFDRDEHPSYEDSIQLCGAGGVHVARSNPASNYG
jgi:hypothetical protein